MNLERFVREGRPAWEELEALVAEAKGRPERLSPDRVRRLGALYRAAAADLALARRRFAADPVVPRLEDLVGRARHLVYDAEPRQGSVLDFLAHGYWRRIRERPVPLLVAWGLLVGPAVLAALWALTDPGAAGGLVPGQFRHATEPRPGGTDQGFTAAEQAAFSSAVFTNNIRVTFFAFAGGITLGIVSALVVLYNGAVLGVVAGLSFGAGNGSFFVELVAAHGILELSCMAVATAAGMRLGWSLVEPGRRRRVDALVAEGRRSVEIVLGTAPWLVLAGVIEGFVSRRGLEAEPSLAIGVVLGGIFWALVLWRGRPPASERHGGRSASEGQGGRQGSAERNGGRPASVTGEPGPSP